LAPLRQRLIEDLTLRGRRPDDCPYVGVVARSRTSTMPRRMG
jgi:hypothetical protein